MYHAMPMCSIPWCLAYVSWKGRRGFTGAWQDCGQGNQQRQTNIPRLEIELTTTLSTKSRKHSLDSGTPCFQNWITKGPPIFNRNRYCMVFCNIFLKRHGMNLSKSVLLPLSPFSGSDACQGPQRSVWRFGIQSSCPAVPASQLPRSAACQTWIPTSWRRPCEASTVWTRRASQLSAERGDCRNPPCIHRISMIYSSYCHILSLNKENRWIWPRHGWFAKSSSRLTIGMVSNVLWNWGSWIMFPTQITHATVLFHLAT